jgi:uncharacterized membrane protein YeaQ/YmgE (transglycosylase-associated protein family)
MARAFRRNLFGSGAFNAHRRTGLLTAPANRRHVMSILAWIVLGLIAGFIASMLVNRRGGSLVLDLLLGVVGAFVGGFLFTRFGQAGVSGINLYSILVATIGAVVVLFIYHALVGRRSL